MKVFLSCPSRITTLAYTSWISSSKSTQIPDLIFPNLRALKYLAFYLLIMYKKCFKHWSRQLKHTQCECGLKRDFETAVITWSANLSFRESIFATICSPVLFRNKNKVHTFRFRRSRRRIVRTFGNKKKRTNVKAYVKLSSYYTVVILFFKMKVSQAL